MIQADKSMLRNIFLILCFLGAACLVFAFFSITYASIEVVEPNVTIRINEDGNISCNGNLFGNDLWYPGKELSGSIRIYSAGGVKISNLGFEVLLNEYDATYAHETVYQSFMDNMKLTVKQGRLLVFNHTILDNKSFADIVENNGISLVSSSPLQIHAGDSVDLMYTLKMDEASGDELENVSAALSFYISFEE